MNNYKEHLIRNGTEVKEALKRLDKLAKDAILFVVDKDDHLLGSLTDGDVRRGLIKGISIEQPVDDIIQELPRFVRKGEDDIRKVIEYREGNFRILPVLDEDNKVIDVINFRKVRSYLPLDAIIMAGGRGERLRPLTDTLPKPLLEIGNKPIIQHNVDRLSLFGIANYWISINYLADKIETHFHSNTPDGAIISYLRENKPLGTIGSVSQVNNFSHEYVLVMNSDILTNIDYEHFFLEFIERNADMAVVSIPYNITIPYAVLETSDEQIISFKEKPTYTYYSNGGIYLMKREVLANIPKETFFNATDLIETLIQQNKRVFSYALNGFWLDIGNHEDFKKAQESFPKIKF